MITNSEAKGIKLYLERLIHPIKMFNFKFTDVEYELPGGKLVIEYDLYIQSKQKDITWLWDYFSCKSKHIVEDACNIVGDSEGAIIDINKTILGFYSGSLDVFVGDWVSGVYSRRS